MGRGDVTALGLAATVKQTAGGDDNNNNMTEKMASAAMLRAGGDGEDPDPHSEQGGEAALPAHGVAEPPRTQDGVPEAEPSAQAALSPSPCLWRPLLSCLESAWSWRRPGLSAALFLGCNAVFWFLALTPWRLYSVVALSFLLLVTIENIKALTLCLIKGWKKSKNLNERRSEEEAGTPLARAKNQITSALPWYWMTLVMWILFHKMLE